MGHSALLRLAYRFESEKLLIPANQVDDFDIVKDISGGIFKIIKICLRTLIWT
jgi:hypothetical protein